jgi:nucleotidyltransferase substrate binding protein (TIGR01987 family)
MNNDDQRWLLRFRSLQSTYHQLDLACDLGVYSNLERAGLIKSFDLAFDLALKTMEDLLYFEGCDASSPREVILKAFDAGILAESEPWLEALRSRDLMSRTYESAAAVEAERLITESYAPMIDQLIASLRTREAH